MGVPADRGPPVTRVLFDLSPTIERPSRDFRITENHRIGQGGLHEKAQGNLAAIRTLKLLEAEDREASDAEKATLARFVGWGSLPNVFAHYPPSEWKAAAREAKELLTPDEYESARASTPNAHFTSPLVIEAVWDAMSRMGLEPGSQLLEPSTGVGHFFGLMPPAVLPGCKRTGVELDSVTARIAQKLYPDATIFAKGFEETPLPNDFFDAVVGNVPFGDYSVHDPAYKRTLTRAIHDYFFAKSLDKLRPGGVMALITSRYTMDKQDGAVRSYLGDRTDLLGAIRLPNTAFKANAGTEVTTDILFLRKHGRGTSPYGERWQELAPIHTADGEIMVNEYFARHPEMMLGEMKLTGTMYRGQEPTLVGSLTPELLKQAVTLLPKDAFLSRDQGRSPPAPIRLVADPAGVKQGGFALFDNELFIRNGHAFEPAGISESVAARVRGMLALRDVVRQVFDTQLQDAPEAEIVGARRLLNDRYGVFLRRHGPVSSRENIRAFAGDPDLPLLLSLENYNPETKHATKTAIFERRTLERYKPVEHVETASEALAVSLNETGEIHWPRMMELTGLTTQQMQRELGSFLTRRVLSTARI